MPNEKFGWRSGVSLIAVLINGHVATDAVINVDETYCAKRTWVGQNTRELCLNLPAHAVGCGVGLYDAAAVHLHARNGVFTQNFCIATEAPI